jgi:hypothetical protein
MPILGPPRLAASEVSADVPERLLRALLVLLVLPFLVLTL